MKKIIIILHGWGKIGADYREAAEDFEKNGYSVFSPDLPGFGANTLKKDELYFEDYVSFVKKYIETCLKSAKQKKVILLGHSFGGRIAIKVAELYPQYIDRLILTGASGIPRPLPSLKKRMVYVVTKIVKPLFSIPPFSSLYKLFRTGVYYSIGEMDYYRSGKLAHTFKNIYQVSIAESLKKIVIPTFLIWGEKDSLTPLQDGEFMHQELKGSQLFVVEGATHKLPYSKPHLFSKKVLEYLTK